MEPSLSGLMKALKSLGRGVVLVIVGGLLAGTARAQSPLDWNEAGIRWMSLDEGLREASRSARPLCLVVYTQTCPHCRNYSQVFHDPRVIERAKKLVMVKIDQGADDRQSARYAPDGAYIPRTLFLSPEGELQTQIHAARNRYLHFYDETNPSSVLTAMNKALVLPTVGRAPVEPQPAAAPTPAITSVTPVAPAAPAVPPAPGAGPAAVAAPAPPSPAPAAGGSATEPPPPPQIVRDPSGQLVIQN